MPKELLFVIGSLAHWIGWVVLAMGIYHLVRAISAGRESRAAWPLRRAALTGLSAIGFFALAHVFTGGGKGVALPLAWPDMHPLGWVVLICAVAAASHGTGAFTGITPEERRRRGMSALVSLGVGALCVAWIMVFKHPFRWLTGWMTLTAPTLGFIIAVTLGTTAVMGWVARSAESHDRARRFLTQVVLFVGAVVFMVPLGWLLVTSLKEDRDIASTEGLVWIPLRTQTVPYMDPKNPVFEGQYQGKTVTAVRDAEAPGGKHLYRITRPMYVSGYTFEATPQQVKQVPSEAPLVTMTEGDLKLTGMVVEDLPDGRRRVSILTPNERKGEVKVVSRAEVEPVRTPGMRWENYRDSLEFLPPEANNGLVYLKNTLILVVLSVLGTVLSCSVVAYGFSRLKFPGREMLFKLLLATMMLPAAVTLLPTFLIYRQLGWIDTLLPLWVPTFFASAFNVFLLRSFFQQIPFELEDAAKIDGCTYLKTFWSVLLPQVKPALTVVAIWTFLGAWNNFMGPLIYINSQENMPIAYALQLFQGQRAGEPGLLMAFTTLSVAPVLALFAFSQRYFIEGVTLSGLGGR